MNGLLIKGSLHRGGLLLFLMWFYTGMGEVSAQYLPLHVDHTSVYDFLDELAGMDAIDINTAVKPYSRIEIATFLTKASSFQGLTNRQKEEIRFYLRDFGKELVTDTPEDKSFDLFYYRDSLFRLSVNPILGVQVVSVGGHTAYHRWHGAEIQGTVGKHFGFYGSLRDNYESDLMGGPSFLQQQRGSVYKGADDARDYSETRGGLTWSWRWGNVGIHKDHLVWGSGYNGTNILSGHTPSFGFFSFKMKPVSWFEFNYIHGALVSEVLDTLRSYSYYEGTRKVYANKYLAAGLFTIKPLPRLYVSLGNSIVYGDMEMNPAYLVPFLFYKSADHTYNAASNHAGQNAQMYLDVSSRQIKHLHLYGSLFIDEISTKRMFNREKQSNYISVKAGAQLTGLPPDMVVTLEYTRNNPMVYQHIIPTTTYESNDYTLGHYLKDNSDEIFFSCRYRPIRGVDLGLSYTLARKGKDYQSILTGGDELLYPEINRDQPRWGLPFMDEVRWKMQKVAFTGSYQIVNRVHLVFSAVYNHFSGPDTDRYVVPFYLGGDEVWSLTLNYGF